MPIPKSQSAIQDARDELFLDSAEGHRLDVVTSNLGLNRPLLEFNEDDHWRYAVKEIALQPKLVRNAFQRALEVCFGPQFSRIGNLNVEGSVDDIYVTVGDSSVFLQTGSITLDPGLATEETVEFYYRDFTTNRIWIKTPLIYDHVVLQTSSSFLASNTNIGSGSLTVIDASLFPASGYPYPIIVGKGTKNEELLTVTNNNGSDTLTLGTVTAKFHAGPTAQFIRKTLAKTANLPNDFIILNTDETKVFPKTGWVRIDGGIATEVIEFVDNLVDDNALILAKSLIQTHTAGASVELVDVGETVETVSVIQENVGWELYETEAKKIYIYVPPELEELSIRDASWIHGPVLGVFSTTLAANVSADDTILQLTSVSGLPDSGLLFINNTQNVFYNTIVNNSIAEQIEVGVLELPLNNTILFPISGFPYDVRINAGAANEEDVTVSANNTATNTLTVTATTFQHQRSEPVVMEPNSVRLLSPIGNSYTAGDPVDYVRYPYTSTDLEDGNLRASNGSLLAEDQFPGPYIFDLNQNAPSVISSTLNAVIPFSTRVVVDQAINNTNLEVYNASDWPTPEYDVIIGRGSGFEETRTLTDITLKKSCAGDVDVGTIVDGNPYPTMDYNSTGTEDFPESDGTNPAGYRVIIARGLAHEETLTVLINDVGSPGTFTFGSAFTKIHSIGETIELLNDVMTFDVLTEPHNGFKVTPTKEGVTVEKTTESVTLASTTSFPSSGKIIINFGKSRLNQRKRLVTPTSATSYILSSTDNFPTDGFPYPIILGEGLTTEEIVFVSANNTGTDTLTFVAPGAVNTHLAREYISYTPGEPEVLEYEEIDGNDLILTVPIVLQSGHHLHESIIYSPSISEPQSDGWDFAFKMPPKEGGCLSYLVELIRAAGIEVTISNLR